MEQHKTTYAFPFEDQSHICLRTPRQEEVEKIHTGFVLFHEAVHARDEQHPEYCKEWKEALALECNEENSSAWKNPALLLEKGILSSYAHFSISRGHASKESSPSISSDWTDTCLQINNRKIDVVSRFGYVIHHDDKNPITVPLEKEIGELPTVYQEHIERILIDPCIGSYYYGDNDHKDFCLCAEDRAVHAEQFFLASRHPQYFPGLFTFLETQPKIQQRLELLVKDGSLEKETYERLVNPKLRIPSKVYGFQSITESERYSVIKNEPTLLNEYKRIRKDILSLKE